MYNINNIYINLLNIREKVSFLPTRVLYILIINYLDSVVKAGILTLP